MLPHAFSSLDRWKSAWRASGTLVLLLDFDGTLAPIAPSPAAARMPVRTRAALAGLSRRGDVALAVISGRTLDDVRRRVGLASIGYAGNHGLETQFSGRRTVDPVAAAARPALELAAHRLRAGLGRFPGALLEDKDLSLSLHFRQVDRARIADLEAVLQSAVSGLEELRVTRGKRVLEVRPRTDADKGRAVETLLATVPRRSGGVVLYLGDDVTDEDAFRAVLGLDGVRGEGVVVADPPPHDTAARAFLRDTDEVSQLLERLADAPTR